MQGQKMYQNRSEMVLVPHVLWTQPNKKITHSCSPGKEPVGRLYSLLP